MPAGSDGGTRTDSVERRRGGAPQGPSLGYRAGMVMVLAAVVVLPILVFALVLGLVAATVFADIGLVSALADRPRFSIIILLLALNIATIAVLVVMVQAAFSRPPSAANPLELHPRQAPALFQLVERVAQQTGAPVPEIIELTPEPNAAASFHGGLGGMIRGRLTLTIGTPLIADLDIRGLASVIAHELGHFSQGGAMRTTWIVRSIVAWMSESGERVGHAAAVTRGNLEGWWFVGTLVTIVCMFVRVGLGIFAGLGTAVSAFMLRQQEFDADRFAARIAGGTAAGATLRRIGRLNYGFAVAFAGLPELARTRRLPDDFPRLAASLADDVPPDVLEQMAIDEGRSGLFDTHPPVGSRVDAMEKLGARGTIRDTRPSLELFEQWPAMAQWTSLALYEAALGVAPRAEQLAPVSRTLDRRAEFAVQLEAGAATDGDLVNPWIVPGPEPAQIGRAPARPFSVEERQAESELREGAERAIKRAQVLEDRFSELLAEDLQAVGGDRTAGLPKARERRARKHAEYERRLGEILGAAGLWSERRGDRVARALRTVRAVAALERKGATLPESLPASAWHRRMEDDVARMTAVRSVLPEIRALLRVVAFAEMIQPDRLDAGPREIHRDLARRAREHLVAIRAGLDELPAMHAGAGNDADRVDHADGGASDDSGAFAIEMVIDGSGPSRSFADDVIPASGFDATDDGVLRRAMRTQERVGGIMNQLHGRVSEVMIGVETALDNGTLQRLAAARGSDSVASR